MENERNPFSRGSRLALGIYGVLATAGIIGGYEAPVETPSEKKRL
tara:strand:+ start:31 stop:165 length:135 start_codon:yes stop_codon:yes gene_type:complete